MLLDDPVGVPGVRLADGAAALHTDPGHSLRSLDSATGGAPIAPLLGRPKGPGNLRKFPGDSLPTFSSVRK